MENEEIVEQIELYASILELEGEDAFKIRSYQNAVFNIEKLDIELSSLSLKELEKLPGIGKAIAAKIDDANVNGIFRQLEEKLAEIPLGVVDLLSISGLGAKKVRIIWKELGIEDSDQLLQACENNQIALVKGFGEKTQENIKQILLFLQSNTDKAHFDKAEKLAFELENYLKTTKPDLQFCMTGQIRRKLEVVDEIQCVVQNESTGEVFKILDNCSLLKKNEKTCGLFAWRGNFISYPLKVEVLLCPKERYFGEVFIHSADRKHLAYKEEKNNQTLLQLARKGKYDSEEAVYQSVDLPFILPELREGYFEFDWAKNQTIPQLLEVSDLKGVLHAHSTYSDGKHGLEVMAKACKDLGYEYLGITDHSKSAFYANGLNEFRVKEQQQLIDKLNIELAPFKIFKGIESDILSDGSLDYEKDVLASFDFIIASVHSGLKMSIEKATERIIKAIENSYTTILGHPTGRILLQREGYPLNHQKIIDACAANKVVIEINASPYRLDLDWRFVNEALEKGVLLSINPDSHEKDTIRDVYYGVCVGRKGGLTKEKTLNTLSATEIEKYFREKKG